MLPIKLTIDTQKAWSSALRRVCRALTIPHSWDFAIGAAGGRWVGLGWERMPREHTRTLSSIGDSALSSTLFMPRDPRVIVHVSHQVAEERACACALADNFLRDRCCDILLIKESHVVMCGLPRTGIACAVGHQGFAHGSPGSIPSTGGADTCHETCFRTLPAQQTVKPDMCRVFFAQAALCSWVAHRVVLVQFSLQKKLGFGADLQQGYHDETRLSSCHKFFLFLQLLHPISTHPDSRRPRRRVVFSIGASCDGDSARSCSFICEFRRASAD